MNLRELKEIFRLVEKTDFREVEITQGDSRIRIERGPAHAAPVFTNATQISQPLPVVASASAVSADSSPLSPEVDGDGGVREEVGQMVTSPFVGTFYLAPSPDSEPYVRVGQVIKKGQVLCIVEAMKLMNELESDFDGKLAEVYPENGQAVEFGEKLFRIVPD